MVYEDARKFLLSGKYENVANRVSALQLMGESIYINDSTPKYTHVYLHGISHMLFNPRRSGNIDVMPRKHYDRTRKRMR